MAPATTSSKNNTSIVFPLRIVTTAKFAVVGFLDEKDYCLFSLQTDITSKNKQASSSSSALCVPDDEEITVKISNTKSPQHKGGGGKKPLSPSKKMAAGSSGGTAAAIPEERPWTSDLQHDYDRIFSVGEECISGPELKTLLLSKGRGSDSDEPFRLYDGFEPSGRMHIAQGVFKAMNVNKCTATPGTNAKFIFWVADWFALMNDKMGGDLEKIKTVGHYLQEVWKAAGMDLTHVEFKWASEEITTNAATYWPIMLNVASRFNITRIKKCCQIMGRLEGSLTAAQVLYPLMQCTDVFFLKADICQLGVDQRKVNMLAREYCDAARIRHKPIILSHHMLYGLKAGQEKMSKSDPDSAIFMEDAAVDVERKILNAYCPSAEEAAQEAAAKAAAESKSDEEEEDAGKASMRLTNEDTLKNPCLDYIQHIIFSPPGATFTAGGKVFTNFPDVRAAFVDGSLSKDDLKRGLILALNELLEPVRSHFTNNEHAKNLLALVQQYKKEDSVTSTTAKAATLRRLNLVALGKVPALSHLVFCPLPTANPTLQEVLNVLAQLASANSTAAPCVLFLSDWTARVCNACDADVKVIASFYTVFVSALRALNPSLMEKVHVVTQSEAILADPSNYWISVINVGRHYSLDQVMGSEMKDADGVGAVIGRLMRVADAAGVEPSSIAISPCDALQGQLVSEFFRDKLIGLSVPTVITKEATNTRLHPVRESAALETENDQFFLFDDPKVHGKSKLKKSFCEPGNVSFCPPIALTQALVFEPSTTLSPSSEFTVTRPESNGGDKVYKNVSEIQADFESGALHPGDLKAATTSVALLLLERLAKAFTDDSETQKGIKALKAFAKKMSKKK